MTVSSYDPPAAGITPLTGPRWSAAAYPLLAIAKDAVAGHAAIGEKVREHAELVAQEREAQRAARAAEIAAAGPAAAGGA